MVPLSSLKRTKSSLLRERSPKIAKHHSANSNLNWSYDPFAFQNDFKIVLQIDDSGGERTYYAHKSVLGEGSDYFQAMCRTGAAYFEAINGTLRIEELHPLAIEFFPLALDFMYGKLHVGYTQDEYEKGRYERRSSEWNCPFDETNVAALIYLADRLDIPRLTEAAVAFSDWFLARRLGWLNKESLLPNLKRTYRHYKPFLFCPAVRKSWLSWFGRMKAHTRNFVRVLEAKKRLELPIPLAKKFQIRRRPIEIHDGCVLGGRGGQNLQCPANGRYRNIAQGFRPRFFQAVSNAEKQRITWAALDACRQQGLVLVRKFRYNRDYPFLDNGLCYPLARGKAYTKCQQYIRDGRHRVGNIPEPLTRVTLETRDGDLASEELPRVDPGVQPAPLHENGVQVEAPTLVAGINQVRLDVPDPSEKIQFPLADPKSEPVVGEFFLGDPTPDDFVASLFDPALDLTWDASDVNDESALSHLAALDATDTEIDAKPSASPDEEFAFGRPFCPVDQSRSGSFVDTD